MPGVFASMRGLCWALWRRPRSWFPKLPPRWSVASSTRPRSPGSTKRRGAPASRSTTSAGRSNTVPRSPACWHAGQRRSPMSVRGTSMSKHHVSTVINGEPTEFLCETQLTLLDVLRDELNLTGSKEGCSSGDCGACSITVDGRLVCSCLMLAVEAEGRKIETIEGMAKGDQLHPLQRHFLEHAALQCGFCTPGILVAAKALLDRNPDPSETEIRYWLAGNLCRCTGYDKIVRAVLDAAAEMRGGGVKSLL